MKSIKDVDRGNYIVHRNEPCVVLKKQNVTYSSHCHTKVRVDVQGIFTGFKDTLTLLPHASIDDADITMKKGQLISKSGAKVQVMDIVSYETFDADIEPELMGSIAEGEEVTFVQFGGKAKVLGKR